MSTTPTVAVATIDANIATTVRTNPGIRFKLVLVPPSDAQLAFWAAYFPKFFEAVLGARRELARQVAGSGNAVLHDFWGDKSIVGDLDRYADMNNFDLGACVAAFLQIKLPN